MIQTRTEDIDPDSIIIPSGFTADPQELESLRSSLKEQGLMHPPLIKDNSEIIAGKKRVLAARGVLDTITCKIYPSNLSPEEYKVIALHENLKRYNLPWFEQVVQEKELHDLRQDQYGKGTKGKGSTGWGLRDTAKELNMALGTLSEDVRMAEAVMNDPSLKRITDKTTARRVIFETVKRTEQELGASRPVSIETNICHLGGSEELLKLYPENTFDACITDPPWLEFKDKTLVKDVYTLPVFQQVYRVLKQNSFLYCFVSTQDWYVYYEEFQKIGFSVQKWPLIWVKEGVLTHGRLTWQYQRDYEPIMLAVKGTPAVTESMLSAVIITKIVPPGNMIHPNEKHPDVIKTLLSHCTFDGSLVLDPFAGSFVVPDVAKQMGRRYVAIEKNKEFFVNGQERVKK